MSSYEDEEAEKQLKFYRGNRQGKSKEGKKHKGNKVENKKKQPKWNRKSSKWIGSGSN